MQKAVSNIIFCLGLLMLGFGLNYTLSTRLIGGALIIVGLGLDPKIWNYFKQRNNGK